MPYYKTIFQCFYQIFKVKNEQIKFWCSHFLTIFWYKIPVLWKNTYLVSRLLMGISLNVNIFLDSSQLILLQTLIQGTLDWPQFNQIFLIFTNQDWALIFEIQVLISVQWQIIKFCTLWVKLQKKLENLMIQSTILKKGWNLVSKLTPKVTRSIVKRLSVNFWFWIIFLIWSFEKLRVVEI